MTGNKSSITKENDLIYTPSSHPIFKICRYQLSLPNNSFMGFVERIARNFHKKPPGKSRPLALPTNYKSKIKIFVGTLILVRHGESEWNSKSTFTGWVDVVNLFCLLLLKCRAKLYLTYQDLSDRGRREIEHAGTF